MLSQNKNQKIKNCLRTLRSRWPSRAGPPQGPRARRVFWHQAYSFLTVGHVGHGFKVMGDSLTHLARSRAGTMLAGTNLKCVGNPNDPQFFPLKS